MEEAKVIMKKAPLLNPLLRLFMVTMVLANISGNMYGPLLPLYLRSLDANVLQVGLFFTLSQIIPLMLQIVGGWVSDSLGRLKSIAIGSVAGALSYVGLILAPTWGWVLVGEGLSSVTRSLVAPSFQPFIAEQSSEETRGRVFALTEMIFTVVYRNEIDQLKEIVNTVDPTALLIISDVHEAIGEGFKQMGA